MNDDVDSTKIGRVQNAAVRIPPNVPRPRIARAAGDALNLMARGNQGRKERRAYEAGRPCNRDTKGTSARGRR